MPCTILVEKQTPWLHNTGSFANSTKHYKYIDSVLKEELGQLYVGVPGFFNAYFGSVASLKLGWPEGARERDVLSWFAPLTGQLLDFAENQPASRPRRRPLAQPHQPVQGSTADRKLDVGFSQILIPGELKSNLSADKASKAWLDLGQYAREVFVAQDSRRFVLSFTLCGPLMRLLQFMSAMLRFLWLNKEQLRFDPMIIITRDKQYIKIKQDNYTKQLVINNVIKRRAHREGDDLRTSLMIKDSWQFLEREEEGELLREATKKDVVNDNNIRRNARRGLDITKAKNYRLESLMLPLSVAGRRVSRIGWSSSVARRKRSSSCTSAPLPPTKRTCLSSLTKGGRATANRVHRRVIVHDYRKAIYKASS
ncbi:hypothetical protein BCR34DRAFT_677209 [Clohesyomyces aquaticus]|uniref:Fungal-type protein kinase domain-containing protein n=1 Tax=Clohesyomyces aquaticus TaxID=1231657 RepID=A0A1Y1YGN0_9PLEO|nr:hypothetical protein BCR34DRAFT_677209 [Clohesyomyces aquaticus]